MTIAFNPNAPVAIPETVARPTQTGQTQTGHANEANRADFGDRVRELVESVDHEQKVAEVAANDFAEGRSNDIHGTMIAQQRAEVSFRLLASVRNRALEAYREIMRMGA